METIQIPAALASFISTRDQRAAKAAGYSTAPHAERFERLLRGDVIKVGGRATCGSRVDASWTEFTAWKEIVKKAQKLGFQISETPVKHGNGWATKAGGFWDESDYQLVLAVPPLAPGEQGRATP